MRYTPAQPDRDAAVISPFAAPPHFVGRGADLARVQALFHDAALGQGCFLLVEGETGIGKSRFLAECASVNPRAIVLEAHCGDGHLEGDDLASQLAAERRRSSSRSAPGHSALLASIAERSKRRPVVLLVDDVQSSTAGEHALLDSLVAMTRRHRVVVVATFVDDRLRRIGGPAVTADAWLAAGARSHRLEPLDESTMEIFVRHLAQSAGLLLESDDMREIVATAQGNPRFAVELVGEARGQTRGSRTPRSARTIARAARHALSKRSYEVLLLCAVAGSRFNDAWIVDASGRHAGEVGDALQAAADLGIIAEDERAEGWFAFRRVAVRKALYASLVSINRKTLHGRIVARLLDAPDAERNAILIGEHLEALGERERASEWFGRAAAERDARDEFGVAAALYRRAIALGTEGSARLAEFRRRLARCYERLGEWTRAVPVMRSMLPSLEAAGDSAATARLLNDLVIAYLNLGDQRNAESVAEAIARVGLPDHHEIALLLLAISHQFSGRSAAASDLVARIDRTKLVSDEAHLRYLMTKAHVTTLAAPLDATLALVDEATAVARKAGPRAGIVLSLDTGSEACLRFGDLERQVAYIRAAEAVAGESAREKNFLKRLVEHQWIGHLFVAGRLPEARARIAASLDWHDGGRHNEAFTAALGVTIGMHLGDVALVDALFDPDLLRQAIDARDAESCGLLVPAFAGIMQVRGMEKEVRRAVDRCIELGYVDTCGWLQMCAAHLGSDDVVEAAAGQIEAYFAGAVAPLAGAHLANFKALSARRRGQHAAAATFAREAALRYGALGWRLSEATAFEIAGDLGRALECFEACSAAADVERLRARRTRKGKRAPFGARLTPRELEVARLAARKWSNADVSRALGLSVRTIDHHLEAAFSKLGIRARWQLTDQLLEPSAREDAGSA